MASTVEKKHECFIVGAIGKPGTAERIHADWFIDGIVKPVFDNHFSDFDVIRADRMNTPGMITSQIIEKLLEASLVIADMTFLNANAFYEIGIRHMIGKPIIHAHRDGDNIPFDVSTFLSMSFSTIEHQQVLNAQKLLKSLVDNVLADGYKVDNPVTQARGRTQFSDLATPTDKVLLAEIENISSRISRIERNHSIHPIEYPVFWGNNNEIHYITPDSVKFTLVAPTDASSSLLRSFVSKHIEVKANRNARVHFDGDSSATISFPSDAISPSDIEAIFKLAASKGLEVYTDF